MQELLAQLNPKNELDDHFYPLIIIHIFTILVNILWLIINFSLLLYCDYLKDRHHVLLMFSYPELTPGLCIY